jgi:hypothetical protein
MADTDSSAEPVTPPAGDTDGGRSPLSPTNFARLVLIFLGAVWLSIGAWGLANPQSLADAVDYQLMSPTAFAEIRAQYGGFPIAVALLHIVAAVRQVWLKPALMMSTALVVGLLTGRLSGLVLDGVPTITGGLLILSEFVMVGLSAFALARFLAHR